jgi:hypothetical protein
VFVFFFFSSFFFSSNKQKSEHQSKSYSAISWTLDCGKASLHHAALKKVVLFLPTSWLQAACMKLQNKQVSITHHVQLPYPPTGKIILFSPWALNPFPQQNWKT